MMGNARGGDEEELVVYTECLSSSCFVGCAYAVTANAEGEDVMVFTRSDNNGQDQE